MAINNYRIAESTLLTNARIFNMVSDKELQNGAIVGKADLAEGETQIYKTEKVSAGENIYLVINPAWNYSNDIIKQNEENYTNEAGTILRAYRLEKDMKFKIGNIDLGKEIKVGDSIKYDYETDTYSKDDKRKENPVLKLVAIEEVGFPYCIGSLGTKTEIGEGAEKEDYGYTLGGPIKKYTFEVMSTLVTEAGE